MKLIVRRLDVSFAKNKQISFYYNLELLQQQHDMHVTPHPIENPYYLCIKTSILLKDNSSIQDKYDRKSIDFVYGKKELEHEYWFSVPKEK